MFEIVQIYKNTEEIIATFKARDMAECSLALIFETFPNPNDGYSYRIREVLNDT